jgi:dTMP kinase
LTAPRFITLEGGEGAGKSTHLKRLGESLRATGETVVLTREPGGSPGAEQIRGLLVGGAVDRWESMTEALLHYAARRDHVERTIQPALEAGSWVISDRFADFHDGLSGLCSRRATGADRGVASRGAGRFHPRSTLILDIPVEEGLIRARARSGGAGEDRYERMGQEFHERLRAWLPRHRRPGTRSMRPSLTLVARRFGGRRNPSCNFVSGLGLPFPNDVFAERD